MNDTTEDTTEDTEEAPCGDPDCPECSEKAAESVEYPCPDNRHDYTTGKCPTCRADYNFPSMI